MSRKGRYKFDAQALSAVRITYFNRALAYAGLFYSLRYSCRQKRLAASWIVAWREAGNFGEDA